MPTGLRVKRPQPLSLSALLLAAAGAAVVDAINCKSLDLICQIRRHQLETSLESFSDLDQSQPDTV